MYIPTIKILEENEFDQAFYFGCDVYKLEKHHQEKGFFKKRRVKKLRQQIADYLSSFGLAYDDLNNQKEELIAPLGDADPSIMNVALAGYYDLAIFDDLKKSSDQKTALENKWTRKIASDMPENPGYGKFIFDEIYDGYRLADDSSAVLKRLAHKAYEDTYGN